MDRGSKLIDVPLYDGQILAEQRRGEALAERSTTEEVEHSLQRRHTVYVDLPQTHDIELGDVSLIVQEILRTMRRPQEQGKMRFAGAASH